MPQGFLVGMVPEGSEKDEGGQALAASKDLKYFNVPNPNDNIVELLANIITETLHSHSLHVSHLANFCNRWKCDVGHAALKTALTASPSVSFQSPSVR